MYLIVAVLGLSLIMARRYLSVFGEAELGGPTVPKYWSAGAMAVLYIVFLGAISLNAYDVLPNPLK